MSPGRGTEKQGGGLKYASVAPETTRVWPRFDWPPIKLSLASRPLPRSSRAAPCLALPHGNSFRLSRNRYIRTALSLSVRPPLPPVSAATRTIVHQENALAAAAEPPAPVRGVRTTEAYGRGQRGVG